MFSMKVRIRIFCASLVTAAGLLALPATMATASAVVHPSINPCTLTAHGPGSGGIVRGYATMSCSGADNIEVEACLQQLVTGGWKNVVGGCQTSQEVHGTSISATGKSYYPTCGRYYRTWAWGYNDGKTGTVLSGSLKGCS
jgi:hypothetical protein